MRGTSKRRTQNIEHRTKEERGIKTIRGGIPAPTAGGSVAGELKMPKRLRQSLFVPCSSSVLCSVFCVLCWECAPTQKGGMHAIPGDMRHASRRGALADARLRASHHTRHRASPLVLPQIQGTPPTKHDCHRGYVLCPVSCVLCPDTAATKKPCTSREVHGFELPG